MIRHAADYRRRGGVMANRPGLTLKKGLHKIRDYRALHRKHIILSDNLVWCV